MKAPAKNTPALAPKKRCAIYTRKSTDEGLDQEYNSLEAQRDSALAFISSQRGEGWIANDDGYDDGGFSGGNINRPALKRLLTDVEGGLIDVVVVYKIDRLSRSLSDFAKIVDLFDARGVTFVSVTQHPLEHSESVAVLQLLPKPVSVLLPAPPQAACLRVAWIRQALLRCQAGRSPGQFWVLNSYESPSGLLQKSRKNRTSRPWLRH
jgi:hypothetical protein